MNYLFLSLLLFLNVINSLFTACLAENLPTSAKIQGITISAQDLTRDLEKDTVLLTGKVKMIYQNQFSEADQVELFLKKKQAVLKGHVTVQSPSYQIGGQQIILDYESNQAIIYIGYVQSNNVRFQGDMIEKMNDTDFYVSNAEYTTCSNCPATWSFSGQKIKAELGGYAYIKNTFLKVADIPVFWLPYLVVPLKSERQTGLLFPEFGHNPERHFIYSQDFFWAISKSQDATFTLKNYELGGLKPKIEYRYVLDENSYGQFNASYMQDTFFSSEQRYTSFAPEENKEKKFNRWLIKSYNQYQLSDKDKLQLQLQATSDLQYPKDFYDEVKNYSDSALENRFTYSHFFEHSLFSIDSSYYINLLRANPLDQNKSSVHRMPDIRFDSTYQKLFETPFYYKIESNWVNFQRNKFYDDLSIYKPESENQKYVSNSLNNPDCEKNLSTNCLLTEDDAYNVNQDIIRTGQRFNLKTSITTETYNISELLNLTPTISYNHFNYLFPTQEDTTSSRRFVQFDLSTRTKFYRIFEDDKPNSENRYKNDLIPEIHYSWIPWIEQDSNPFFGDTNSPDSSYISHSNISNNDLNTQGGVLFDYNDHIYDRHLISFTLLDRFIRKKIKDNTYKTLMTFRLTQSYDLHQSQYGKNKDQPLSDLSGVLTLDFDQIQSYTQVNYYPYKSATNTTTSISYLNDKQQYLKVGWSSKRTEDPKQDDISLAVGFVSNYVNLLTGIVYDASAYRKTDSRLRKISLITQLKPPGECWAVNIFRNQVVDSSPEWHITFDFSFDGKPTKVIPPAELNIN